MKLSRKGTNKRQGPHAHQTYPHWTSSFEFLSRPGFFKLEFLTLRNWKPDYRRIYHYNRYHACKHWVGDRKELADAVEERGFSCLSLLAFCTIWKYYCNQIISLLLLFNWIFKNNCNPWSKTNITAHFDVDVKTFHKKYHSETFEVIMKLFLPFLKNPGSAIFLIINWQIDGLWWKWRTQNGLVQGLVYFLNYEKSFNRLSVIAI